MTQEKRREQGRIRAKRFRDKKKAEGFHEVRFSVDGLGDKMLKDTYEAWLENKK